jgi:hypothetical protein
MNKKQIQNIAKATKQCHPNRMGAAVSIFADGSYYVGADENTHIARDVAEEGIEHRILMINFPMSAATVARLIAATEAAR